MSKKLISIIIPTYNYAHYLQRAVDSVMQQLPANGELIVVDDGSIDNTQTLLVELQAIYPDNFHHFKQSNRGAARARNFGAEQATGEYLLFLDADDVLTADALSIYTACIHAYPHKDYFIARHQTIFPDGHKKNSRKNNLSHEYDKNFVDYLLKKKIQLANGAILIKSAIFDQVKYSEALSPGEDIPTNAKLMALFDGYAIDKCLLLVHRHTDSLRHDIDSYVQVASQIGHFIFDDTLPHNLHIYRLKYETYKLLSLFRSLYIAQKYVKARKTFLQALQNDYKILFQLSYVRKFVKSFLWSLKAQSQ